MSWIDELGLRRFDDGGETSWSSWTSSPSYESYVSQNSGYSGEGGDSGESRREATPASDISSFITRNQPQSASGEGWVSGSGAPVLTGEAARALLEGRISWDDRDPNAPGQYAFGDIDNGVPGYKDPQTGKWKYGTSRGINPQTGANYTYDELKALSTAGSGGMDVTRNQTVDQALAAMEFDKAMTQYVKPIAESMISGIVPGGGLALSGLRALQAADSGKTTYGQAATDFGLQLAANKLGLPYGLIQGAIKGSPEEAAAGYVTGRGLGEIAAKVAQDTGVPVRVVSQMLQEFGVAQDAKSAVTKVLQTLRGK